MPTGISGSNVNPANVTINGAPADEYVVTELRVISNLLANLLGSSQAIESLGQQRADQGFELGFTLPPDVNG